MTEYTVGSTSDISPNEGKRVEINGIPVAVFNVDGEYYAILDQCPHKGASLSEIGEKKIGEGLIDETKGGIDPDVPSIYCPWHYWEWDLKTGQNPANPRQRTRVFDTKVDDGEVKVVL